MARQSLDHYLKQLNELSANLEPSKVALSFDAFSDTLMLHLQGYGVPGVSIPIAGGWMLRVHRDTDEVIGIQIEGVLTSAALKTPFLLDVLAIAEIDDLQLNPIEITRRKVAAPHSTTTLRRFVREFEPLAVAD